MRSQRSAVKSYMKQIGHNKVNIYFTKDVYIYLALLLLLVPLRLLLAAMISAAIHELFHIAAILAAGKKIYSIRIGHRGTVIQTEPMDDKEEVLCAIAGPLSGLFLVFFFRWIPVIALTGAVQSLYNLLPLYPTDGGRVLQSGARILFSNTAACKIVHWTEIVTLSIVIALCLYGTIFLRLGIIPVVFSSVILLKQVKRK